jgi:hypothetical protein
MRGIDGPTYDLRVLDLTDNRVSNVQEVRHLSGCIRLEDLAFRQQQQHHCNPICSHPAYAAVVAASCGTSLRTLDGESLVVHLARMGRDTARPGFVGGAGEGGGPKGKGEQEASSASMVDSIIANMLEGAGAADAAEAEGRGVKIPVRQLQEIFPERARGSRSRALDPGIYHIHKCVCVCVYTYTNTYMQIYIYCIDICIGYV